MYGPGKVSEVPQPKVGTGEPQPQPGLDPPSAVHKMAGLSGWAQEEPEEELANMVRRGSCCLRGGAGVKNTHVPASGPLCPNP